MIIGENAIQFLTEDAVAIEVTNNSLVTMKRLATSDVNTIENQKAKFNEKQKEGLATLEKESPGFKSRLDKILIDVGKTYKKILADNVSNASPEKIKEYFDKNFFKIFTDCMTAFTRATKGEILIGVLALLVVIVINSVLAIIFTVMFGPLTATAITAIFVAPLTEESGRAISLRAGGVNSLSAFTASINVFEFVTYVQDMLRKGVKLIVAIPLRIIGALFHSFLQTLQLKGYAEELQGKKDGGINSLLLAMLIHGLYNFLAMLPVLITRGKIKNESADDFITMHELSLN